MRALAGVLLVLGVFPAGRARAATPEAWPPLEQALNGPLVQLESAKADLRRFELPGGKCPRFPVREAKAYRATVRFEPTRSLKMDVLIAKLPDGFETYGPIVAAAHDPAGKDFLDGCLMPKSGLSLVQVEQYLLAFPTVCSDIYPYRKSLPVVMAALQKFWGPRFAKKFIYAPCGTMFPRLVDVGEYLKDPKKAAAPH